VLKMPNQTEERHLQPKEVAALMRKLLKHHYPKQKFNVRTKTWSGGASVWVRYQGGPNRQKVENLVNTLQFARFDSMTDYGYTAKLWVNMATGEAVTAYEEQTHSNPNGPTNHRCPGLDFELCTAGKVWVTVNRERAQGETCAVCGEAMGRWDCCENKTCERVVREFANGPTHWVDQLRRPEAELDLERHQETLEALRNNYDLEAQPLLFNTQA
jgi:hypothetical protein